MITNKLTISYNDLNVHNACGGKVILNYARLNIAIYVCSGLDYECEFVQRVTEAARH